MPSNEHLLAREFVEIWNQAEQAEPDIAVDRRMRQESKLDIDIRGHLCEWPTEFLSDDDLGPKVTDAFSVMVYVTQ